MLYLPENYFLGRCMSFLYFTNRIISTESPICIDQNDGKCTKWYCQQEIRQLITWYIRYGSSEIDAHVWNDIGNLVCLRHFFNRQQLKRTFFYFLNTPVILYTCATSSGLPSYIRTMAQGSRKKRTSFFQWPGH